MLYFLFYNIGFLFLKEVLKLFFFFELVLGSWVYNNQHNRFFKAVFTGEKQQLPLEFLVVVGPEYPYKPSSFIAVAIGDKSLIPSNDSIPPHFDYNVKVCSLKLLITFLSEYSKRSQCQI
jgi:hypothetical protein